MERKTKKIDVVLPVYCEEKYLGELLSSLIKMSFNSISVVDADSPDASKQIALQYPVIYVNSPKRSRASQMNLGAKHARADYLLFLHADIRLPDHFEKNLDHYLEEKTVDAASFQLVFDRKHWFLQLNAFFSRFNYLPFQFGDQGLLIKRKLFEKLQGFDESLLFMEGNEIIRRIKKSHSFYKIPLNLTVSSRKYNQHGIFRLQMAYYLIYSLHRLGVSQSSLKKMFFTVFRQQISG